MKFNVKYKGSSHKNNTSGEVRKLLAAQGCSNKMAKEAVALSIRCFFEGRKHFEVANIPHVTLLSDSIDKKVMEAHRNHMAEKEKNRQDAEVRADENEKRHKADEKAKAAELA